MRRKEIIAVIKHIACYQAKVGFLQDALSRLLTRDHDHQEYLTNTRNQLVEMLVPCVAHLLAGRSQVIEQDNRVLSGKTLAN